MAHLLRILDIKVLGFFNTLQDTNFLHFFYFVTLFADLIIIIVFSIALSIFLYVKRQRLYIFFLWFALILGEGLTFLGKYLFHRERPTFFIKTITENSYAFPSGHATAVVLFYGFLAYLIIKKFRSTKVRIAVIFFLILFVVLIDLSRLYLGVHYLTDVIAGNLVGFGSLILSIVIIEHLVIRNVNK